MLLYESHCISFWAVWLLIQRTHKASNWYLFLPSSFHLSPNIKNYSSSISMMNRSIWPQVIRISKIGSDLSLANYLWLRRMTHREIGQVWRTVKEPVREELQSEVMDGPLEVRDPIKYMHNFMLGWVHYFFWSGANHWSSESQRNWWLSKKAKNLGIRGLRWKEMVLLQLA